MPRAVELHQESQHPIEAFLFPTPGILITFLSDIIRSLKIDDEVEIIIDNRRYIFDICSHWLFDNLSTSAYTARRAVRQRTGMISIRI